MNASDYLQGMANLDRVIAAFDRAAYLSSYETRLVNQLKDARDFLSRAADPALPQVERRVPLNKL